MKILISAFKPFNNETINPSLIIAEKIAKNYNEKIKVIPLNVEYNNDSIKLINEIKTYEPDYVFCLGQAGGRSKIALEYFALNMQSASIKDNIEVFISHNEIIKDGKEAYKSNIDLLDVVSSLKNERLTISYNAGTFICNEIYYNSLKYIYENNLNTKCVFIHIPFIETQVENRPNIPFVSLNDSINIITDIIKYVTKI